MNFGQQLLSGHNDKDGVFYLEPPVLQLHGSVRSDITPYLVIHLYYHYYIIIIIIVLLLLLLLLSLSLL